ncbi:MAG: hypothetical protein QOJ40_2503, partial [Verrucomicrobiota bacterium]
GIQMVYNLAVKGYLDYCSRNAISVTTESARAYMDDVTRRGLAERGRLILLSCFAGIGATAGVIRGGGIICQYH